MTIPKSAQFKRAFFLALLAATHPPSHRIEQDEWNARVLPHTAIESLADNLWHVTGVLDKRLPPREMVLYRLPDTTLLIHSAIALNPAAMDRLESLGRPKILIVPNRIHRLDAALYKQRYPTLQVICPAAARSFVEAVVPVDGIAEEILPRYGIVCHSPAGIYEQELAYELPLPSGRALVFTDILFNLTAMPTWTNTFPSAALCLAGWVQAVTLALPALVAGSFCAIAPLIASGWRT